MDKPKFETPDMVLGNIEKIGELFPVAIAEIRVEGGKAKKSINFEALKQLLSRKVVCSSVPLPADNHTVACAITQKNAL